MISRINERRRPLSLRGDIADLSVTTEKLANGAVTETKISAAVQAYLTDVNARLLYLEPGTAVLEAASNAIASGTATTITPFWTGRITSRFLSSNSVTLLSGDQLTSGVPVSSGILTVDTSFTLLTIDWNGEQADDTITISAVQLPTALLTVPSGITNLALGANSTTLLIQFTNGIPTFDDQPLLPNNQPITNNGTFIFDPPLGTTRYTLTVTNAIGQTASSFVEYTVTLLPPPTALLTVPSGITLLDEGASTTLNIQFANGTPTFDGQPLLPNGQPITNGGTYTFVPPLGPTRYTLTVTNSAQQSISSFVDYTVLAFPTASLLASNGNVNLLQGDSTTITIRFANGTPTFDGQPLLPNGQPITNGGTYTVTPPLGNTRYTLTVTNALLRSFTEVLDYAVTARPAPTASLSASNGVYNLVENTSTTLNIQFANGTPTFNGQALLPNGQPITNNGTFTVTPPLGNTRYTLTVTNAFTGQTATSFVDYTVTAAPTGWYGNIVMELESIRSPGDVVAYNYSVYRGSTTATPIATNVTVTNSQGNGAVIARVTRVDESERLPNSSSTFLVVVNRESINNGDLGFTSNNVTGGTITSLTGFYTAIINPTAANNANITIRFYISDP